MEGDKSYAVNGCRFSKVCFGPAVNRDNGLAAEPFCGFDYSPFHAAEIEVGWLSVEDG
jgi:hypothetical protein